MTCLDFLTLVMTLRVLIDLLPSTPPPESSFPGMDEESSSNPNSWLVTPVMKGRPLFMCTSFSYSPPEDSMNTQPQHAAKRINRQHQRPIARRSTETTTCQTMDILYVFHFFFQFLFPVYHSTFLFQQIVTS